MQRPTARTRGTRATSTRWASGHRVVDRAHTLRKDGGYDFTITWSGGDTTQQCGHSIQKTTVFKEYIASKGIKKGPAIKKPS